MESARSASGPDSRGRDERLCPAAGPTARGASGLHSRTARTANGLRSPPADPCRLRPPQNRPLRPPPRPRMIRPRPLVIAAVLAAVGLPPRAAADPPLPEGAKLRLGQTRFRTPYAGRLTVLSRDGRQAVVFEYPETLQFLSVETGEVVKTLKLPDDRRSGGWNTLHRTADGRRLVATLYNSVLVLDPATGAVVHKLDLGQTAQRLGGLAGGPDGKVGVNGDGSRIAVGTQFQRNNDGPTAVVLDTATGNVVATVTPGQTNMIRTVLSRDGKLLATFGQFYARQPNDENWAAIVQIWDAENGTEKCRVKTGARQVQA